MARSNDIQYVRFYTSGSAAEQVELPRKKKAQPKPKPKTAQLPLIKLDGLSTIGLAVAAVMLLCMIVGLVQVSELSAQRQELELYVANLEIRNDELEAEYAHGYDMSEVKIAAQSMGLVPEDQVRHITVSVPEADREELTWWQEIVEQIKGLFA